MSSLDDALAEVARLTRLVFVPGLWRCAKCGFQLQQMNLNGGDGSVSARDEPGDKCPNDGSPLWRVTEREAGNKLIDQTEELFETMAAINQLRADEGHSVTLLCDNPDFHGPNNAVEVIGAWTDWAARRFEGETLLGALRAARAALTGNSP